jgi:hypothetical protein
MPDRTLVVATSRYWWEVFGRAFWNSLLYFFEKPENIWKAIVIFCLGAAATTLLVWIIRSREALTEHVKTNIGIAIGGGLLAWIVVFIAYAISEPFMQQQRLSSQLDISSQRERAAVIGKETAELQRDESAKRGQRIITLQGPCKLTAEQINPARLPQSCPGAPPPTLRDRVLAINTHLTEGDRNRFSNALSEFEEWLNQGDSLFLKIRDEGIRIEQGRRGNNWKRCAVAPNNLGRLDDRRVEASEGISGAAIKMGWIS